MHSGKKDKLIQEVYYFFKQCSPGKLCAPPFHFVWMLLSYLHLPKQANDQVHLSWNMSVPAGYKEIWSSVKAVGTATSLSCWLGFQTLRSLSNQASWNFAKYTYWISGNLTLQPTDLNLLQTAWFQIPQRPSEDRWSPRQSHSVGGFNLVL